MPIVFEEMSGEIVREPRRDEGDESAGDTGLSVREVEAEVRAVMARERRRALRLSDR